MVCVRPVVVVKDSDSVSEFCLVFECSACVFVIGRVDHVVV